MRSVHKKESWLVACLVVASVMLFAWISFGQAQVIRENPPAATILSPGDFVITTRGGSLTVGQTNRAQAMQVFPVGNILGTSGLYRPHDSGCLLTFSEPEQILIRMDLNPGYLATSRGIKANDSFDKVVAAYGSNYTKAYEEPTPNIFDAYYGSDRYILFKVKDNVVEQIFIGSPAV